MTYVMRLGRAWMREPWDEAEDIVQVVMQRARNARLHFDRNRSFSAWIMTIAHNQTLNYARARENRIRLERGASIELYGADSLGKSAPTDHLVVEDSEDSARRRNIERFERAIRAVLDVRMREVMRALLSGMKYAEAWTRFGFPTQAALVAAVHRAKTRILNYGVATSQDGAKSRPTTRLPLSDK